MADLNAPLEKKFFNISVAKREAVIQPHSVLDGTSGETMTVRLEVSRHGKSAYPKLT